MKIAGVLLVAIGLEGIVTGQYLFTFVFVPLGVFVSMLPIRIKTGVCIACRSPLEQNQAICPKCGAPQTSRLRARRAAGRRAPCRSSVSESGGRPSVAGTGP